VDGFKAMTFAEAGPAITGPPPPPMAAAQHIDLFRELPDTVLNTLLEAVGPDQDSPMSAIRPGQNPHRVHRAELPAPEAGEEDMGPRQLLPPQPQHPPDLSR